MTSRWENYAYTASGLDNVTLCDLEVRHCDNCGNRAAVIPMIEKLHELLRKKVALSSEPLRPSEIRFLRSSLGMSKTVFAEALNTNKSSVGRWETGETKVSPMADRLIRFVAMKSKPVESYLDELVGTQPEGGRRLIRVQKKSRGWAEAA